MVSRGRGRASGIIELDDDDDELEDERLWEEEGEVKDDAKVRASCGARCVEVICQKHFNNFTQKLT